MCYIVEEVWELEFQNENRHFSLNLPQPLLESHSGSLNLRFIICRKGITLYDWLPCISNTFTLANFQLINTTFTPPLSSYTLHWKIVWGLYLIVFQLSYLFKFVNTIILVLSNVNLRIQRCLRILSYILEIFFQLYFCSTIFLLLSLWV